MFIKEYTIMNYETTKYRDRASQEVQPGSETAQEIRVESGHRTFGEGMWYIATPGVSLCARGGKDVEGITSSRRERSSDGEIARKDDRRSPAVKQEDAREYQWDYNRSDKDLPKAQWDVREIITDRLILSMSLTG